MITPDNVSLLSRLTEHHHIETTVVLEDGASILVTGGEVTVDSRRDRRRQCSLELLDTSGALGQIVTAYGINAALYQTLTWDDGSSWTCPLGQFVLSQPVFDQDSKGVVCKVEGDDLSRRIARAGRVNPITLVKTTLLTDAIDAIVGSVYPDLTSSTTDGADPAIGSLLNYLEGPDVDPWKEAVTLADSFGYDMYFDVNGALVLTPYPDATAASIIDVSYDPGPITKATLAPGDEGTYSGVVVVGVSVTGTPLRAEVWDTDPNSPTYVNGPYGYVPKWVQIETPTTYDAMLNTGRAVLAQVTGASRKIEWQQIPNPGHEAWDIVNVTLPDLGVYSQTVLVDSVTIPLGLDVMTLRTRDGRWLA